MALLRAKQLKLAEGKLLVGSANGNGVELDLGAEGSVLRVSGTTIGYELLGAADIIRGGTTVDADITTLENSTDTNTTNIANIIAGVGLAANGTYIDVTGTNYIDSSTSIVNALTLLDSQLNTIAEATGGDTQTLQSELNDTQAALGINANGSLVPFAGTYVTATHTTHKAAIDALDAAIVSVDSDLQSQIDALTDLNALNFAGVIAGDAVSMPTDVDQGDVFRITTIGATDLAGTGISVNVGDFVAVSGFTGDPATPQWVKFDNTDPSIAGDSVISVTGSAHEGYDIALTGIVPVANGGTGLDSAAAATIGHVLTVTAAGTLGYAFVNKLYTSAGVEVASVETGKLIATTATVDADGDLTVATKGFVDASITEVTDTLTEQATEDHTVVTPTANYSFALANTPVGNVDLFFNGLKLLKTAFSIVGVTVTLNDAAVGYTVEASDVLSASYMAVPQA